MRRITLRGLPLLAGLLAGCSGSLMAPQRRAYEREEFRLTFQDASASEVRRKLGNPDAISVPCSSSPDRVWTYRQRTRQADRTQPDPEVSLRFHNDRVFFVIFDGSRRLP